MTRCSPALSIMKHHRFSRATLIARGRTFGSTSSSGDAAIAIRTIAGIVLDVLDIRLVIPQEALTIVALIRERRELQELLAEALTGRP